jgi:HlyD family secretion protein
MPGMTCAGNFIVDRSENVLVISNAALRYQPTSLSSEQIDDMVFNAGLANMNDEQRFAAVEARALTTGQNPQQQGNNNNNIVNLLTSGGQPAAAAGGRGGGGGGGMRQGGGAGGAGGTAPAQTRNQAGDAGAVMRNLWHINGDGRIDVMRVRIGITNGSITEIFTSEDIEGKQVIMRERI